jgi:glycosyltransferase involved in cell wall biosynthesis
MQKKLLIIDGQIFQTDARDRGMGRYSARFIESLLEQNHYDMAQLIVAKNSHNKHPYNEYLHEVFPNLDIVRLDLINTTRVRIEKVISHNKKEVSNYISDTVGKNYKIDYLIPSPFQEPVVSVFPEGVKKILIFYDLIPYLYYDQYRKLMNFDNYLKRFSLLFEADKILTISQSVRDDLMVYLGISSDRIMAIDGAAIRSDESPAKPLVVIPDKYILMPTSDDPRKNNLRAVLGFEKFRSVQNEDYKLIITSKIHKNERIRLEKFSKNLLFTGNIKEAELDWLYYNCQAVLFVSESEGLGLPILEAVLTNKRVVCSSINVFKEISKDAFYYCDHEDQNSIADAITSALATSNRSVPKREYQSILKHYNWGQTAKRSIRAIDSTKDRKVRKLPKIAIFIPAPDGLSAVGKFVAEGHPTLSKYFDIDYYAESGQYHEPTRPNYLQYLSNYYPAESFGVNKYMQYEAVIYHIGNSDYHIESIRNSLYLPGYTILHDTNVSEAYRIMFEKGMISSERRDLEEQITTICPSKMSRCISSVVNNQLGIITHSKYATKATQEVLSNNVPIKSINLSTYCSSMTKQRDYSKLTIGLAGIIADIKGIQVIEAIANNSLFADCNIKLFGYNYATKGTMNRLRSYNNVTVSTDLTDFDFQNNISKLDIFVNYRMKYQGETSLSTIEAMRQGVVVIVRNVGWYSELPDDAVIKVNSEEEAIEKLLELKSNPDKLMEISNRAILYIQQNHTHRQYAEGIADLIESSRKTKTDLQYIVNEIKSGKIRTSTQLLTLYQQISKGELT